MPHFQLSGELQTGRNKTHPRTTNLVLPHPRQQEGHTTISPCISRLDHLDTDMNKSIQYSSFCIHYKYIDYKIFP